MDLIEDIKSNYSYRKNFIVTSIDYFIRWVEVVATKNMEEEIIKTFVEKLITKFGTLMVIISENGIIFLR